MKGKIKVDDEEGNDESVKEPAPLGIAVWVIRWRFCRKRGWRRKGEWRLGKVG